MNVKFAMKLKTHIRIPKTKIKIKKVDGQYLGTVNPEN